MWNLRGKIKSDTELNEYDLFIENQFADAIMLIFFGLKKKPQNFDAFFIVCDWKKM